MSLIVEAETVHDGPLDKVLETRYSRGAVDRQDALASQKPNGTEARADSRPSHIQPRPTFRFLSCLENKTILYEISLLCARY